MMKTFVVIGTLVFLCLPAGVVADNDDEKQFQQEWSDVLKRSPRVATAYMMQQIALTALLEEIFSVPSEQNLTAKLTAAGIDIRTAATVMQQYCGRVDSGAQLISSVTIKTPLAEVLCPTPFVCHTCPGGPGVGCADKRESCVEDSVGEPNAIAKEAKCYSDYAKCNKRRPQ